MNTDASILVYKFRPQRTGFNLFAEYTQLQLTFLALQPWFRVYIYIQNTIYCIVYGGQPQTNADCSYALTGLPSRIIVVLVRHATFPEGFLTAI